MCVETGLTRGQETRFDSTEHISFVCVEASGQGIGMEGSIHPTRHGQPSANLIWVLEMVYILFVPHIHSLYQIQHIDNRVIGSFTPD